MLLAHSQDQTNAEHADVQYCTVYMTQGADPLPPFSKPVTAGSKSFKQVYYPPPPYWYRRVM